MTLLLDKLNKIKSYFIFFLLLTLVIFSQHSWSGFHVDGARLLDGNGQEFIMRGINHGYAWYQDNNYVFKDIAKTGANTVRVVLSNGDQWQRSSGDEVKKIIEHCETYSLVCVLEVHDSTGFGDVEKKDLKATHLSNATAYWISEDIKQALMGKEDYVIINIANEPFGNGVSANTYVAAHNQSIAAIRKAGLTHTIMIDAANWGQDWQGHMRDNAAKILKNDDLKNVIFSVHMYEVYNTSEKIDRYMKYYVDNGLVLVIGEFATSHFGHYVDAKSIMLYAEGYNIGYIGWSWSGNNESLTKLDVVVDFDKGVLKDWGKILLNDANGIKQTSALASIYTGIINEPVETCQLDSKAWPICKVDNGDWGWENQKSCISRSRCPTQAAPLEYCEYNDKNWLVCDVDTGGWGWNKDRRESCISKNLCDAAVCSLPNGTEWPICANTKQGWGWEHNTSCISNSECQAKQ